MIKHSRVSCWPGIIGGASLLAAAAAMVPAAAANQVVEASADTGAAALVDLATAPELPNPPQRPINTLHNNISWANHLAAKRKALAYMAAPRLKPVIGAAPSGRVPVLEGVNIAGITEAKFGGFPPDGDIAVSQSYVLHIVNFGVSIYNKAGTLLKQVSFATFFNNNTDFIFDPRAFWDPYWDRFVVMADGQSGSRCNLTGNTCQSWFELAISTTGDPRGSYYIYRFPITPAGDFMDFPDMGMDQDAIILTANNFPAGGGFDAKVFALAKARMYSGMGTGFTFWGGSGCTIAPPYVLDNNPNTYLLVACPNDVQVYLGVLTNTSRSNASHLFWQAVIPVPGYSVAPDAPQPGVDYALETGDNEFEQRSVQLGSRIWNVHTILDGTATPRWYEFDTGSNTLVADGIWYASITSSDWHPSIVMNTAGETFGTWMSVDAPGNLNLSLHFNGGSGDNAGSGGGGTLFTSTQALLGQTFPAPRHRAGDFSYIALDPSAYTGCSANRRAWLEGEITAGLNLWGTRIGRVGNC
jgi:hypothetical protein